MGQEACWGKEGPGKQGGRRNFSMSRRDTEDIWEGSQDLQETVAVTTN